LHRGKRILLRVSTGFAIEVMTGGFYSVKLPNQAPYQLGHTRITEVLYMKEEEKAIIISAASARKQAYLRIRLTGCRQKTAEYGKTVAGLPGILYSDCEERGKAHAD